MYLTHDLLNRSGNHRARGAPAIQTDWANAIKSISKLYLEKGDFQGAAAAAAGKLYGYGHGNVLFKPTKATDNAFRPTTEGAMSYFIGCANTDIDSGCAEDAGFAFNSGKGFSEVIFENHQIELRVVRLQWQLDLIILPVLLRARNRGLSTPLATSATRTVKRASSFTTHQSPTNHRFEVQTDQMRLVDFLLANNKL